MSDRTFAVPEALLQQLYVCASWGPACCGCSPPDNGVLMQLRELGVHLPGDEVRELDKFTLNEWLLRHVGEGDVSWRDSIGGAEAIEKLGPE